MGRSSTGASPATDAPPDAQRRFFIVTTGRSGSTLLSVILADCGADFAMPAPKRWDREGGDMEHGRLVGAATWFRRAYNMAQERPASWFRRYAWTALRSIGKRSLRSVLADARYLKGENMDLLVYPAFKLGYVPSIIVSYRPFEDYAISGALRSGHSNLATLVGYYNRVYRTALLQMSTFGGCAVNYDRLADPQDVSWAPPLSAVTGIPVTRLIEARQRRARWRAAPTAVPYLDRSAQETFWAIEAVRENAVVPSGQILRSYQLRRRAAVTPLVPWAPTEAARSRRP